MKTISLCLVACLMSFQTLVGAVNAPATSSWVDLSRYSGDESSHAITRADYQQLMFELQNYRSTQPAESLSSQQQQPYETLLTPRNNQQNRFPLSLIHWDRDINIITPEQKVAALDAGTTPESVLTNVAIFAVAPIRKETYRGCSLILTIDSDDFAEQVTSSDKAIQLLSIDAGDGSGWQDLAPGQELAVSYTSTGIKTISVQAQLADGSTLHSSSSITVSALYTPAPTDTVQLYGGQLYVYKSGNHTGLRNPVFVVEGFDMNNDMDWDVLYNLLNKEGLAETLRSFGRDLIVLDFTNAMADINTKNSLVAIDAINYINANRSNPHDKFTVIGASMGGLVTRLALVRMEKFSFFYGESHVDTWISFDSPQEGSNIPLSLQRFFKFFGDISKVSSTYASLAIAEEYRVLVDSPAAQQMLMCHHLNTASLAAPSPSYSSFASTMRLYGYPANCKAIAISNGSRYGTKQPFLSGAQILNWKYRDYFYVDIDAHIHALPKSASVPSRLFYGRFNPFDLFNSIDYIITANSYYPYNLDNASGGTRASFSELYSKLPSAFLGAGSYCNYNSHCFIPTTSALGIPKEHLEKSIYFNQDVAALSPFDEIYCAISNEEHININRVNKEWFMKAVLEGIDSDGDLLDDYQEYLRGTDYATADKIQFEYDKTTTGGEGDSGSGSFNAVVPVFGIGPATASVYVLPGSATASDYLAQREPYLLTWAEGEAGTKDITIPIRGDRRPEMNEQFYLILRASDSEALGQNSICTVTILDDDGTAPNKGVFVAGIPLQPEGGRVTGSGYFYNNRSVRLSALANPGWTFIKWESGYEMPVFTITPGYAYGESDGNVMLQKAVFKRNSEISPPALSDPGQHSAMVGVSCSIPLAVTSECAPKVVINGLPRGLKYDANTAAIIGVPMAAGVYNVICYASNPGGDAIPCRFTITVDALSDWAQGSFNGFLLNEDFEPDCGLASMQISRQGRVSGTLMFSGKSYRFQANALEKADSEDYLMITTEINVDNELKPLQLSLAQSEYRPRSGSLLASRGSVSGYLGAREIDCFMCQDVWSDKKMDGFIDSYTGYYTASFSSGDSFGSGYLTLTVSPTASVKMAGKLADGTSISQSGTLIFDGDHVYMVLYSSPRNYLGGCIFGLIELEKSATGTVNLEPFSMDIKWSDNNPQATGTFGEGFARELEITGGWYNKILNLRDYYLNGLVIGDLSLPSLTASVRYTDWSEGGTQKATWQENVYIQPADSSPAGLVLNITPAAGIGTGMTAPRADTPEKQTNGSYEYTVDSNGDGFLNTSGLSFGLTRSTGLFKGTFKAWYDYASTVDHTTDIDQQTHTSKSITYQGVLTPERKNTTDGIEGRGFYLLQDKGIYDSGRTDQYGEPVMSTYSFKWSYDFLLLKPPQ